MHIPRQSLPKGQQSRNVQLCPQSDLLPFRSAQAFSPFNSHFQKKVNKTTTTKKKHPAIYRHTWKVHSKLSGTRQC